MPMAAGRVHVGFCGRIHVVTAFLKCSFFKQRRPLLIYNIPAPAHGDARARTQTHNGSRVPQMKTRLLSDDRCRTGTYSMLILGAGSSVTSPIARQAHLMSLLYSPLSRPPLDPPFTPTLAPINTVCVLRHTRGHTVSSPCTAELVDPNVAVRGGSTNGSRLDLISCGQSITLSQA